MKRISQREARRLRKRVDELERIHERQRSVWVQEWVDGVQITSITYDSGKDAVPLAVRVARKLGHAVVVVGDETGSLRFIALPHAK